MQLVPSIKPVLVQIQKPQDAANGQRIILTVNAGLFGQQKKLQIVEEAAMFSGLELALMLRALAQEVLAVAAAAQAVAVAVDAKPLQTAVLRLDAACTKINQTIAGA
jgi:hypothetical protein